MREGETSVVVDVERYNSPLVENLRGVLDDLARETGGRKPAPSTNVDVQVNVGRPLDLSIYTTDEILTMRSLVLKGMRDDNDANATGRTFDSPAEPAQHPAVGRPALGAGE